MTLAGSSPLARGTQVFPAEHDYSAGLIPARAGNTALCIEASVTKWAHPRSRGEHLLPLAHHHSNVGSSPLARGTLLKLFRAGVFPGLIPARAGNTAGSSPPLRRTWAHPRSRGEHRPGINGGNPDRGSSPLARGTRDDDGREGGHFGLIPARAGNT